MPSAGAPSHCQVSLLPDVNVVPPPKISDRPRWLSNAIALPKRGDGPVEARCVQTPTSGAPSHSQVSPNDVSPLPAPPNSTVRPRSLSYAMRSIHRGGGPAAARCTHVPGAPSYSHVSPAIVPFGRRPP